MPKWKKIKGPMEKQCQFCKKRFPRPKQKNSKNGNYYYISPSNFERKGSRNN